MSEENTEQGTHKLAIGKQNDFIQDDVELLKKIDMANEVNFLAEKARVQMSEAENFQPSGELMSRQYGDQIKLPPEISQTLHISGGDDDKPVNDKPEDAPKVDENLEAAKAAGNTWDFKGKTWELYLANQTGGMARPVVVEGETVGIIGAEFAWNESEPFLDYLDFEFRNETNIKDQVTESKNKNEIIQGAKLFRETCQKGFLIPIDEFGNRGEQQDLTRAELMEMTDAETQSDLAINWIIQYRIRRHFPEGYSKLKEALKPSNLFFEFYIGENKNPRHCLLFEFDVPTKDARRSYEDDVRHTEREQEGDNVIVRTIIDNKKKLNFAKKYFRSVKGVTLNQIGNPFQEGNDQHTKDFKLGFNPRWFIALADEIVDAFHTTGK